MAEARSHPNNRYWLLKTICLNNLYGVDLMGEAAEIAKLRLFLKLAAQLDDASQIEPLPDLDFNIRSGNLLVGIADLDDAQHRLGDSLMSTPGLVKAVQAAEQTAGAYDRFAAVQFADPESGGVGEKLQLAAQIADDPL